MQKSENSFVKDFWILVGNEVIAGDDGKLGIGDRPCNKTGVLILDHIIIAGDDKSGTFNL